MTGIFKSPFKAGDGDYATVREAALPDGTQFLNKLSMKSSPPTGSQLPCDSRDEGLYDRPHWSALSTDPATL